MKNDKVKTLGNYSPSEHNASKIVDVEYSAPTVRENHGTVTAIVDDTYRNRNERVYEDASPSLRAGRSGLKVANNLTPKVIGGIGEMKSNNNTQYYMQNRIYEGETATTIPANESFQPYYAVAQRGRENGQQFEFSDREMANAITTVQKDSMVAQQKNVEAKVLGKLSGGKWDKTYGSSRRVFDPDYSSPTICTHGGGNQEEKFLMNDLRIRKLTPRECFRLMGVKDEDVDKLTDLSNSTLYHLAGDSIVTTVLMAIFGELLEVEWKEKVNTLHGN